MRAGASPTRTPCSPASINLLDRRYEICNDIGVGAPQFGLRRTLLASVAQRF